MIYQSQDITKNIEESCDVCVVGSGAGGAVMAKELAEAGLSVILLEEGGYFQTPDFQSTDHFSNLMKLYRDGGVSALMGKPNILFGEGRCVGGSTTVNGGMCWRTPNKILKQWQWEKGLANLTPKKMEFFYERVEKIVSVNPVIPEARNQDSETLKRGAERLGYRIKANKRNNDHCVGTNFCITGCPTGGKRSPLLTYIPAFINAGGRLYCHTRVKKVRWNSGRVNGVVGNIVDPETKKKKHRIKIHAQLVVVCGGAIQSPALLKRSRIPNKSRLLGRNLFAHPNTKVIGVFDDPIKGWQGVNQAYQITEYIDEGIMMAVNFLPPGVFALALPFLGPKFLSTIRNIYNHSVVGAALVEDTSRGRIRNLPFDQALATYSMNQHDFHLALRATAILAEIYFAAGAKRVFLPFPQLPEIHTVDEIRKIFRLGIRPIDLELMTVHVMGTCQMGSDEHNSVVDSHGEVHGVKGLFVADASVMPTSIGVNPQETIMALSTRTAFYIAENASSYLS